MLLSAAHCLPLTFTVHPGTQGHWDNAYIMGHTHTCVAAWLVDILKGRYPCSRMVPHSLTGLEFCTPKMVRCVLEGLG